MQRFEVLRGLLPTSDEEERNDKAKVRRRLNNIMKWKSRNHQSKWFIENTPSVKFKSPVQVSVLLKNFRNISMLFTFHLLAFDSSSPALAIHWSFTVSCVTGLLKLSATNGSTTVSKTKTFKTLSCAGSSGNSNDFVNRTLDFKVFSRAAVATSKAPRCIISWKTARA